MDAEAAHALQSLIGKGSVRAVSPDGDEISCKVQQVDGDTVRVLLPRLKMAGIDKLILRARAGLPSAWPSGRRGRNRSSGYGRIMKDWNMAPFTPRASGNWGAILTISFL